MISEKASTRSTYTQCRWAVLMKITEARRYIITGTHSRKFRIAIHWIRLWKKKNSLHSDGTSPSSSMGSLGPPSPTTRPRASTADTPGYYVTMSTLNNRKVSVRIFHLLSIDLDHKNKKLTLKLFSQHRRRNHLDEIYLFHQLIWMAIRIWCRHLWTVAARWVKLQGRLLMNICFWPEVE